MVAQKANMKRTRIDACLLAGAMGWLGRVGVVMAGVILDRVECNYRVGDVIGSCCIVTRGHDTDKRFVFEVEWPKDADGARQLANMTLCIYKTTMDLTKNIKFSRKLTDGFREVLAWEWDLKTVDSSTEEEGEGELQFGMDR